MAKTTYTLNLYRGHKDDTPTSRTTITKKDGTKAQVWRICVKAEKDSDLFKIPSGTNPRGLNKDLKKVKAIRKTFETMPGFCVFNGGLCIIVDDGSIVENIDKDMISLTCDAPDAGHYDGQHTNEAARQGISVLETLEFDQQLNVMLVENCFFDDVAGGSRRAAEYWNDRDGQKLYSEQNQRGAFDVMKFWIHPVYMDNIGFRQHDRNKADIVIKKECRIDRIVALLYTGIPVLRSEELDAGDTMYGILRLGERSTKLLENEKHNPEFEKMYPILNTVLELSDYIQSTLRSNYGNDTGFNDLAILRKATKRDLNKDISDRKHHKQYLFAGEQVEESLLPEYVQPIMYGLLKNVLTLDANGNAMVSHGWSMDDLKAMWDFATPAVLDRLDDLFQKKFIENFNSRHAEFGCWGLLWTECEQILSGIITRDEWRADQAAAK